MSNNGTKQCEEIVVEFGRSAQQYLKELVQYMMDGGPRNVHAIGWTWERQAISIGMPPRTAELYRMLAVSIHEDGLPR